MPCRCINRKLPTQTLCDRRRGPRHPSPGSESKSEGSGKSSKWRAFAPATIARASGCSLGDSTAAANRSTSSLRKPCGRDHPLQARLSLRQRAGLVDHHLVTFSRRSSAAASLMSTPFCAPRPTPTMIDIGVARPSAHGHAMISTETAPSSACASCGGGPDEPPRRAQRDGNQDDRRHEQRGHAIDEPLHRRARALRLRDHVHDLREQRVAAVALAASRTAAPLVVPADNAASVCLSTGSGSPVSIDSSTWLAPSTTTPSTGIFSPGRTRNRSPTPDVLERDVLFRPSDRSMRDLRRELEQRANRTGVCARARSSSTCPSSTSVTITAAASKYSGGAPDAARNDAGRCRGAAVANTENDHAAPCRARSA